MGHPIMIEILFQTTKIDFLQFLLKLKLLQAVPFFKLCHTILFIIVLFSGQYAATPIALYHCNQKNDIYRFLMNKIRNAI